MSTSEVRLLPVVLPDASYLDNSSSNTDSTNMPSMQLLLPRKEGISHDVEIINVSTHEVRTVSYSCSPFFLIVVRMCAS